MVDDRVALVTGGSRGIGRGICIALARLGLGVAINFRANREEAERTLDDCINAGARWAGVFQADVSVTEDRRQLVDSIVEQARRIDILVNNAGIATPKRGELLEATEEAWDAVMAANLKGPFFLSQLVALRMIELRKRGIIKSGHIINVTSISAATPSTNRGDYCISKAGLSMATQLFAHRLASENIQVHEIRPGIIRTDMSNPVADKYDKLIAEGMAPMRRWGEPEEIGLAVAAIAEGKFPFSTGHVLNIDGGFHSRHL